MGYLNRRSGKTQGIRRPAEGRAHGSLVVWRWCGSRNCIVPVSKAISQTLALQAKPGNSRAARSMKAWHGRTNPNGGRECGGGGGGWLEVLRSPAPAPVAAAAHAPDAPDTSPLVCCLNTRGTAAPASPLVAGRPDLVGSVQTIAAQALGACTQESYRGACGLPDTHIGGHAGAPCSCRPGKCGPFRGQ